VQHPSRRRSLRLRISRLRTRRDRSCRLLVPGFRDFPGAV